MIIFWSVCALIGLFMYLFASYWWYRDKTLKDFKNFLSIAMILFISLELAGGTTL
jgi:hypothetical protein